MGLNPGYSTLPVLLCTQNCNLNLNSTYCALLANSKSGDQANNMASTLETTTVTYHIDDEDIPCQGKISKTPSEITLGDFKKIIPQKYHKHKFFFKNKDDEFGIVKQEITDDNANLPLFDGRIVSWLVATEGKTVFDLGVVRSFLSISNLTFCLFQT